MYFAFRQYHSSVFNFQTVETWSFRPFSMYLCPKLSSFRMLACVSSPQPEVRQAAAYGCGVLGQFGGPGLAAAAAQAVPLLCEVIQAPDSRAVENINPTENAISAVTKILQFNGSAVNLDQVFTYPELSP